MLMSGAGVALMAVASACTAEKPVPPIPGTQTLSAAGEAAIRDSVKAVLNDFTSKMNKKDFVGAGNLYSDDSSFSW
ncbi:MAG: hypothetical protein ABJC26_13415, partial [Gemmatimonadaceae bacterium]